MQMHLNAHLNVEHLNAHSNASITLLMHLHLHLNAYLKHLHLYLNATHKHMICQMHNQMRNRVHTQFTILSYWINCSVLSSTLSRLRNQCLTCESTFTTCSYIKCSVGQWSTGQCLSCYSYNMKRPTGL